MTQQVKHTVVEESPVQTQQVAHSQELSAAVFYHWSEPLNLDTSEQKLIHCQTALEEVTSWQREEGSARHSSVTVTERHYVDLLQEDYQEIAQIMERVKKEFRILPGV